MDEQEKIFWYKKIYFKNYIIKYYNLTFYKI